MHFTIRKHSLLLWALLLFTYASQSQATADTSLFEWFDKAVCKQNLSLYNGPLHINYDRTPSKDNHRYYKNQFESGAASYEGQEYFAVQLKYDVYRDMLIAVRPGSLEAIDLIRDKIKSFNLDGKLFVNLNHGNSSVPEFAAGFNEMAFSGKAFILYIKHRKELTKIIQTDLLLSSFKEKNVVILFYDGKYSEIKSRKDIIELFPEAKKNINEFYKVNRYKEQSNLMLFMSDFHLPQYYYS